MARLDGLPPALTALTLALSVALAPGCGGGAKTPEEAYQRLAEAVTARDARRLYDALDLETRWSWMSVQRAQRESYDIVLSNFPEGHERERALRRFETGAHSESAGELFGRELDPQTMDDLGERVAALGPSPVLTAEGTRAESSAPGGKEAGRLVFRKTPDRHWGWGYAGLADRAEQIKRRALADLELMRSSAADYERAATRASR
jgi:hypothetical protein